MTLCCAETACSAGSYSKGALTICAFTLPVLFKHGGSTSEVGYMLLLWIECTGQGAVGDRGHP